MKIGSVTLKFFELFLYVHMDEWYSHAIRAYFADQVTESISSASKIKHIHSRTIP